MKSEDYIEREAPSGLLLRVNMRHGTFLVFENGQPKSWPGKKGLTQIHPLLHIVFLGENFLLPEIADSPLVFFPMSRGYVHVGFHYQEESDIRHMRIPLEYEELDLLPALVFQFKAYWPGPLPALGDGRRYFITDTGIQRQNIVRIKNKYPRARLIVFNPDDYGLVRAENKAASAEGGMRAVDQVEQYELDSIMQNPVFAARIFLRKMEWKNMYAIPLHVKLAMNEIEIITGFMEKMYKNSSEKEDLRPHIKDLLELIDFYDAIRIFASEEMNKVKTWYKNHGKGQGDTASRVVASIEFQRKYWLEAGGPKLASFYRDALRIVKEMISGEIKT